MYNESAKIAESIGRLRAVLQRLGRSWELILVNDGSTDGTGEAARQAIGGDPAIHLIDYSPNRGRGYALRRGFAKARGEWILSTESDLTWGEAVLERLPAALETAGVDFAIASPHMPGGRLENVPGLRVFLSRYGNRLLCLALGRRTTMASGMTRCYRAEVLRALDLESDDKEIHLEILSKAYALGFRSVDVPAVLRWEPERKRRGFPSAKLLRFAWTHLLFGFQEGPFLLFGTAGLGLMGLGTLCGGYAAWLSIGGTPVAGRPLLTVTLLCLLFGLQILLFAFLAAQLLELRRQNIRLQRKWAQRESQS